VLSKRKQAVLRAVVNEYTSTAEPVGSRTIFRRHGLGVSSATIRNEMADLEEMGYLEQPHTSAGRIPSDLGYRYYVDHLMELDVLSPSEREILGSVPEQGLVEKDTLLVQVCRALSQVSSHVSLVMGPRMHQGVLLSLRLVHVDKNLAMALLLTDRRKLEHRLLILPPEVRPEHLEDLAAYFTSRLAGRPLEEITQELMQQMYHELFEDRRQKEQWLEELASSLVKWLVSGSRNERIYLGGAQNILNQPEFRDLEKVRQILALLEEEELLYQLLECGPGVTVTIGQENTVPAVQECAVITATYQVDDEPAGVLAILGPTRMDYAHVISLLNYMAERLSETFSRAGTRT
jgi:heat-inducible transcriptional repressor